jgi:hypothetical protein
MTDERTRVETARRTNRRRARRTGQSDDVETAARRFGALNLVAGLLGFVGPLVWGNDDDLVNVAPGQFLGKIAVNGRHAAIHALYGALGLAMGRDEKSARRYMGLGALLFGVLSAAGWRSFAFEPGLHVMRGIAMDRWANVAHGVLAGICLSYTGRSDSDSDSK